VYRRCVGECEGERLLDRGSIDHYLHACYFVLTVFTTVGFGDMSANSNGEILYVMFVMLVGAVVHSIIVSEVINLVTQVDRTAVFVNEQQNLIDSYAGHTEMEPRTATEIKNYLALHAGAWMSHRFDRDAMNNMIGGRYLPRSMIDFLPYKLYEGKLMHNRFLQPSFAKLSVPPRLPLMLALNLHKAYFKTGEVIYQRSDYSFNLFLVFRGTFAFVGRPTASGGVDDADVQVYSASKSLIVPPCQGEVDHRVNTRKRIDPEQEEAEAQASYLRSLNPQMLAERMQNTVNDTLKGKGVPSIDRMVGGPTGSNDHVSYLFPYRLFGPGRYFGDVEMIWQRMRLATARCESSGEAMVLHKTDFKTLTDAFPQFGHAWGAAAKNREIVRKRMLGNLRVGHGYVDFAVTNIQRAWRVWLRHGSAAHTRGIQAMVADEMEDATTFLRAQIANFNLRHIGEDQSERVGPTASDSPEVGRVPAGAPTGRLTKDVSDMKDTMAAMMHEMRLMRKEMRLLREGEGCNAQGCEVPDDGSSELQSL